MRGDARKAGAAAWMLAAGWHCRLVQQCCSSNAGRHCRASRQWHPAWWLAVLIGLGICMDGAEAAAAETSAEKPGELQKMLDAPLLFTKRFNYVGIHIYDTFYKWRPGGGIYILENPSAPPAAQRIRPLIDPTTPDTLGAGIYSDPELSWDARRVLFCFKPSPQGSNSIYEIGIDGRGLRRVTDPTPHCGDYKGSHSGVHDVSPAYMPDGRIVFTSTRRHGLVPCANEGVDILHVMNADGSDIHPISVNNVNEFDPCMLADGRILHGRWEYVDKTALTQQSVWTIFPDGTNETALFANNMVKPEALLDARPVPDAPHLFVASFTPHNSPPRGSIGLVDTRLGKDGTQALVNFEHPDKPDYDRGNSCEPWPLSKDVVLYSGQAPGQKHNAIMIIDRSGRKEVVYADPKIDCHSPIPIKPRTRPPVLSSAPKRNKRTGRFFLQDVYRGLDGVKPGEVKFLRVIEETSRTSATPGGAMNQTFLMSGALAWSAKNYLGAATVEPDGSAYFEVPSGRAIYFQAVDGDGRLIQSMRTFVQAAPGVTRSCIGCHEHKYSASANHGNPPIAFLREPEQLRDESWGSGFIDYPGMIQPILDKHCVRCHGGEEDIAAGLDLTGGWTEYFSISYENLINRRETQLTATLISGIDCMNGTSLWSARIFPPRSHGSGSAPLAEILANGHDGHIKDLSRAERDLLMAWIDTNGLYHGTWDYSKHGCRVKAWNGIRGALAGEMKAAGCNRCHGGRFENDWINLQRPELSRILRAPLAKGKKGFGLGLCRDVKADPNQRVRILATGHYLHAVTPLNAFKPRPTPSPTTEGDPVLAFASTGDPHYQKMLAILQDGQGKVLSTPRVDMPGAEVIPGSFRQLVPPLLPETRPALSAKVDDEGIVNLAWERSTRTIGLTAEVHRGVQPSFTPTEETLLTTTPRFEYKDAKAPHGTQHYALVLISQGERSEPIRATVNVPAPKPPPGPKDLAATPAAGRIDLKWQESGKPGTQYHVYRAKAGSNDFGRITAEPTAQLRYGDTTPDDVKYAYKVTAVNRAGIESAATPPVTAAALPVPKGPVFDVPLRENADAAIYGGGKTTGTLHGKARVAGGAIDLQQGGHVTFPRRGEFALDRPLSIECWVYFTKENKMPVVLSAGHWQQSGWFLQRIGAGWRWHVGGIDCDGGAPAPGRWTHLVGTYDGRKCQLFQDGKLVAEKGGTAIQTPWQGPLFVGQYSGIPGPEFQVTGWMTGVKIYNRALASKDAAAACQTRPAPPAP